MHIQAYFEDSEKNLRNDGVSHATQVFKEETNRESGKEAALEKWTWNCQKVIVISLSTDSEKKASTGNGCPLVMFLPVHSEFGILVWSCCNVLRCIKAAEPFLQSVHPSMQSPSGGAQAVVEGGLSNALKHTQEGRGRTGSCADRYLQDFYKAPRPDSTEASTYRRLKHTTSQSLKHGWRACVCVCV